MTTDPAEQLVAEARRAVHEALVVLPAPEADRVRALIADLETAVEGRTAIRMADEPAPAGLGVSATPSHTDQAAAARVRALHQQYRFAGDDTQDYCAHCNQITGGWIPWPCPTVQAVGEDATAVRPSPAVLTETERKMLHYALDEAQEQMLCVGDEFSEDDHAAIDSLRRLADEAQQPDTEDGDEQADGPTWSDTCPHCKRWYTTSEPGAHEAACPMRPGAEAQQQEPESGCAHCGGDHSWDDCQAYTAVVADAPEAEPPVHGESVAHLAGLHDGHDQWADDEQPVVPVHAVPLPGSNGISACCGRPPCEFVGERVTRDPEEVTCTGPAVDARQDGEA
ncbi:hypothetical protein ACFYY9_26320 [Streptomyces nigra]|uniref:hypothetical protein n=1 Tax=Streptomyces nigra TaxID=1827580 RepID=UPI0036C845C3